MLRGDWSTTSTSCAASAPSTCSTRRRPPPPRRSASERRSRRWRWRRWGGGARTNTDEHGPARTRDDSPCSSVPVRVRPCPSFALLPSRFLAPLRVGIHPDPHRLLVAVDGQQLALAAAGQGLQGGDEVELVAVAGEEGGHHLEV